MSSSSSLCNLELTLEDLSKLAELDPLQSDGFQTAYQLSVPVHMLYTDELGTQTTDIQALNFQILNRMVRGNSKDKEAVIVDQVKICISSEADLYLNLVCNCNRLTFESMRNKNSLNLDFNEMASSLESLLKRSISETAIKVALSLTYEGIGRLSLTQETEYKSLELINLNFTNANLEVAQQSIIYRYGLQTQLQLSQNKTQNALEDHQRRLQYFGIEKSPIIGFHKEECRVIERRNAVI